MKINLVSDWPAHLWERQEILPSDTVDFAYSYEPVPADWWVVFDTQRLMQFPSRTNNVMYVPAEPPEIALYSTSDLEHVPWLASPSFPQFAAMPQWVYMEGYLPWLAGLDLNDAALPETVSIGRILELRRLPKKGLSLLDSGKTATPMQQWRRELGQALAMECENAHIFGHDQRLNDKYSGLGRYQFTVAIENSVHRGYFTEKLLDALLTGSHVFYAGPPDLPDDFASQITLLPPFDTHSALSTIETALKSHHLPGSQMPPSILHKYTLQFQVTSVITAISQKQVNRSGVAVDQIQVRKTGIGRMRPRLRRGRRVA